MKNKGNAHPFPDFNQSVQIDFRIFYRIYAVSRPDGNSQGIHTRSGNELLRLLRVGIQALVIVRFYLIRGAYFTKLGLHLHISFVRVFHHFPGNGHVFLKAFLGSVNHDGLKTGVNRCPDYLHILGMIQMQRRFSLIFFVDFIKTPGKFFCGNIKPVKFIG